MDELAAAIEASRFATALRGSRWIYPFVNAGHILGVALLVGAIVPMDLRLIGLWRPDVDMRDTLRLLRPVAAVGAGLAVLTGLSLFAVQATEYVPLPLFAAKMTLVALGLAHALAEGRLAGASRRRQRIAGGVSLAVWPSVLVCGRMLGYV